MPIQSHLPQLPWDVPAFDADAEVSLADNNTFVYPAADTRDWMCPVQGEEGGWRQEEAEQMYKRGGEFLREALKEVRSEL